MSKTFVRLDILWHRETNDQPGAIHIDRNESTTIQVMMVMRDSDTADEVHGSKDGAERRRRRCRRYADEKANP